jgi:hypothetical protein
MANPKLKPGKKHLPESILINSSRASPTRSRSLLSTTKINPKIISIMEGLIRKLIWLTMRILEVVSPQRAYLVLSSDVPNGEGDVLVLHSLDVESCK